jgi:hypothetical protein
MLFLREAHRYVLRRNCDASGLLRDWRGWLGGGGFGTESLLGPSCIPQPLRQITRIKTKQEHEPDKLDEIRRIRALIRRMDLDIFLSFSIE